MRLKRNLLILLLLISINTFSQERRIIGRILDLETQRPIEDANIVILGTTSGTFSNKLGFFELTVDPSKHKSLIVSHIGFKTSEVIIPAENRFKFLLEKEFIRLNQLNLNLYPRNLSNELKSDVSETKNYGELVVVESGASFPGGMDNFYDFIGNSLNPEISLANGQSFNVTFTINEIGQAVDILISDSTELIKFAVRQAFQKMPNWVPATQRQKNIPQYFVLPIVSLEIPDVKSLDLKDFYSFISSNIKYPAPARRMGVEGAVYVEFQINNLGNVTSIKLLKDIGADCGDEVRRIMAAAPTELTKSLYNKTKFTKFILPVSFGLGKPFKDQSYRQESDALLLSEVAVTAIGIERGSVVIGYPPNPSQRTPITIGLPIDYTYNNLSRALEKPKAVARLSLVNYNLNEFPLDILSLTNLEFLDIEKNQIQTLPNKIETLSKLQELYLFENQIQILPSNFGNLKKLKVLGLAFNQLKSFPLEITLLDKLEALDLSHNQLSSIPSEIGNMKNLKFFVIQNNNISNFPQEFYQLKKLEKIFIQGNPIDPKDIELLKSKFKKAEIVF